MLQYLKLSLSPVFNVSLRTRPNAFKVNAAVNAWGMRWAVSNNTLQRKETTGGRIFVLFFTWRLKQVTCCEWMSPYISCTAVISLPLLWQQPLPCNWQRLFSLQHMALKWCHQQAPTNKQLGLFSYGLASSVRELCLSWMFTHLPQQTRQPFSSLALESRQLRSRLLPSIRYCEIT